MGRANLLLVGALVTSVSIALATGCGVAYAVNSTRLSTLPPEAAIQFNWSQILNLVGTLIGSAGGVGGIIATVIGYLRSGQAQQIISTLVERIQGGDTQGAMTFAALVAACIAMKAFFKGSSKEAEAADMLSKLLQYASDVEFNRAK